MSEIAGGIRAAGIRRSFGSVQAIENIDFHAPPGRVTALIGPNGSGKTTLLLILGSLLAPDAGEVSVGGEDPVRNPAAVRRLVGWMPDTLGVWESLTSREILTMMGSLYGMPKAVAADRARELLAAVRLEDLADRPARVLSRGQQQRLSLARAQIHSPEILLLDEPASGLDPGSRVELRQTLRRLADEGRTVVVSSHVLSELDEIADRAVFISAGRSVKTQTLEEAHTQSRRYRIQAVELDQLVRYLTGAGVHFSVETQNQRQEVQLQLATEADAALLLRELIGAGVPVSAFAPSGGALEETYMSLEAERK